MWVSSSGTNSCSLVDAAKLFQREQRRAERPAARLREGRTDLPRRERSVREGDHPQAGAGLLRDPDQYAYRQSDAVGGVHRWMKSSSSSLVLVLVARFFPRLLLLLLGFLVVNTSTHTLY